MDLNPLPAKRRIRSLMEEAIERTRKKQQGTTWEKSIKGSYGSLSVKIVYPPRARGLQRLSQHYPSWSVRFTGNGSSWSLKPGNAAVGPFIEQGTVPRRLSPELWRDLQAILP